MGDYEHEQWVELYKTAIVELEEAKMAGAIRATRAAITTRLEKLKTLPGLHAPEQQAIADALSSLRVLEREEAQYQAEEKQRALEHALHSLRQIEPAIKRVTDDAQDG
jgi:hypothetical protein